jgi:DNA-binding MarR family transcriptional regulator
MLSARGESQILAELRAKLPVLLPNLQLSDERDQAKLPNGGRVDLLVSARFKNYRTYIAFEVKSSGEPRIARGTVSLLREWVGNTPGVYPVFVAPFIGEVSRTVCQKAGVGYLDLLGNAFLEFGPVLIDRTVPTPKRASSTGLLGVFTPKGTRIARYLLVNEGANVSITNLARECGLSPAGAFRVVEGLELRGYVERDTLRRVKVIDSGRLLTDWATAWSVERNAKSLFFTLEKSPDSILKKVAEASREFGLQYAATLMAGASLIDPFVRYDDVWIYTDAPNSDWETALDLKSTDSGANLVLLAPYDKGVYYGARNVDGVTVVSTPQLYVDLYNYPARGREQADHLRETLIRY